MGLTNKLLKQYERPSGHIGKFVGWMMSVSNKERLKWMLEKMELSPNDRVLEIGYGTGDAIHAIAGQTDKGIYRRGRSFRTDVPECDKKKCSVYIQSKSEVA